MRLTLTMLVTMLVPIVKITVRKIKSGVVYGIGLTAIDYAENAMALPLRMNND